MGQTRDDAGESTALTTDNISSALEAFENETFDNWSEELKPTQNVGAGEFFEGPQEPMVEEAISKSQGMITGDRGNLYYSEELKKAVDGMYTDFPFRVSKIIITCSLLYVSIQCLCLSATALPPVGP